MNTDKATAARKAARLARYARYAASLKPMTEYYRAQDRMPVKPFNGGATFRATCTR